MRVKNNQPFRLFLQESQSVQRYFVITDWDEDKNFTIQQSLHVDRHDWIHKPGLPLQAVIHIDEPQTYDVALVILARKVLQIDPLITMENLLHIVEIHRPEM